MSAAASPPTNTATATSPLDAFATLSMTSFPDIHPFKGLDIPTTKIESISNNGFAPLHQKQQQKDTIALPSLRSTSPKRFTRIQHNPTNDEEADALYLRYKTKTVRTFLKDNKAAWTQLPIPLPKGIPYVANFTPIETLIEKNIIVSNDANATSAASAAGEGKATDSSTAVRSKEVNLSQCVMLTQQDIRVLYAARCIDLRVKISWAREVRFLEILSSNCKGQQMNLRSTNLGPVSAEAVAHVLSGNTVMPPTADSQGLGTDDSDSAMIMSGGGSNINDGERETGGKVAKCGTVCGNSYYSILDLSCNTLRDKGAEAIAKLLTINTNLVFLNLGSNDIGIKGAQAIAAALETNNTLVNLNLGSTTGSGSRNHIGPQGAIALGNMLTKNKVISSINICNNSIGVSGIAGITSGLIDNPAITELDISSNNIGDRGCEIFVSVLKHSPIVYLNLQKNNISDVGICKLCDAFCDPDITERQLEVLLLDENNIGRPAAAASSESERTSSGSSKRKTGKFDAMECGKALGKLISYCSSLRRLSLSKNNFSSKIAIESISKELETNISVEEINLNMCKIDEKGIPAIAKALHTNKKLCILDLGHGKMGDNGAKAIADAISANNSTRLRVLNLQSNGISDLGSLALVHCLKTNTTLQNVNLHNNRITSVGGEMLENELRLNHTVFKMDIDLNNISYKFMVGIKQILERNRAIWEAGMVERLEKKIAYLREKEKELFRTQEERDNERRLAKEKTDQLLRRKEEARHNADHFSREKDDLQEKLDATVEVTDAVKAKLWAEQTKQSNSRDLLEQKRSSLTRKVEQEKDKKEKLIRDEEKQRKLLNANLAAEAESLKPVVGELESAELERGIGQKTCKKVAEELETFQLAIKEHEMALGIKVPSAPEEKKKSVLEGEKDLPKKKGKK